MSLIEMATPEASSPGPHCISITSSQPWNTPHLHHVLPALEHTASPLHPPSPGPHHISIITPQPWTTQHLHHILPALGTCLFLCRICSWLSWWFRWYRICLQCRRPGFDPWSGRSPGAGYGNPLQDSCLENPMDLI